MSIFCEKNCNINFYSVFHVKHLDICLKLFYNDLFIFFAEFFILSLGTLIIDRIY